MSAQPGVRELFDENAATYDRVNTVISLGLDARWRDWAARSAVRSPGAPVLDAFAGTGLVGLRAAALGARVTLADVSPGMLAVAEKRARERGLGVTTALVDLEAAPIDLPGGPFDAVTIVFGVRYLERPVETLRALADLLRPEGKLVVVEFVEPDGGPISRLAGVYFFRVLPVLARLLAGRRDLYDTLTETTHAMGAPSHLVGLIERPGSRVVETREMGFGLVLGVVARARTAQVNETGRALPAAAFTVLESSPRLVARRRRGELAESVEGARLLSE